MNLQYWLCKLNQFQQPPTPAFSSSPTQKHKWVCDVLPPCAPVKRVPGQHCIIAPSQSEKRACPLCPIPYFFRNHACQATLLPGLFPSIEKGISCCYSFASQGQSVHSRWAGKYFQMGPGCVRASESVCYSARLLQKSFGRVTRRHQGIKEIPSSSLLLSSLGPKHQSNPKFLGLQEILWSLSESGVAADLKMKACF